MVDYRYEFTFQRPQYPNLHFTVLKSTKRHIGAVIENHNGAWVNNALIPNIQRIKCTQLHIANDICVMTLRNNDLWEGTKPNVQPEKRISI